MSRASSEIVLWHGDGEFRTPTAADAKDSNEYEEELQAKKRKRVLLLLGGVLVVVGAAIAITLSTGSASDASQSAGVGPAATTLAPQTTAPAVPLAPVDLPTDAPVVSVNATLLEDAVPANTTGTPTPTTVTPEPTTVTPSPTPAPTPAPTQAPTPPPTQAPTPAPGVPASVYRIQNGCDKPLDLWWRTQPYKDHNTKIPGHGYKDFGINEVGKVMFKNGPLQDVTLFESNFERNMIWYDLSTIPADCGKSWDYCTGKGVGFNVGMTVEVVNPSGGPNCKNLSCMQKGCADAYKFPNDHHTQACGPSSSLIVTIYC